MVSGYAEQRVFNAAMKEIEKVSCVRFVKRTTEYDTSALFQVLMGKKNKAINNISLA